MKKYMVLALISLSFSSAWAAEEGNKNLGILQKIESLEKKIDEISTKLEERKQYFEKIRNEREAKQQDIKDLILQKIDDLNKKFDAAEVRREERWGDRQKRKEERKALKKDAISSIGEGTEKADR